MADVQVKLLDHESGIMVEALRGVSCEVPAGQAVALIGPSGSGKSTLLSVSAGLVQASAGSVMVAGRELASGKRGRMGVQEHWMRALVGVAFQFPERGFFAATVRDEVGFTPARLGWDAGSVRKAVESALSRVGLDESFADRSPFRLSGGEKRRVALAAAIAHRPKLVLLDEPEVGLDLEGSRQVENLIRALKEEGAAVVVATHDVGAALRWADRCLLLQRGRLTAVVETASGLSREGLGRLSPYLWDGGTLNRLQREGEERGVELSDPYKAPDAFLAALRSSWEPLEPSVLPFSSPKAMSPSPPLETDRRR